MKAETAGSRLSDRRLRAERQRGRGLPKGEAPGEQISILGPLTSIESAKVWCVVLARMTAAGNLHPREARRARHEIRAWRRDLDRRDGGS